MDHHHHKWKRKKKKEKKKKAGAHLSEVGDVGLVHGQQAEHGVDLGQRRLLDQTDGCRVNPDLAKVQFLGPGPRPWRRARLVAEKKKKRTQGKQKEKKERKNDGEWEKRKGKGKGKGKAKKGRGRVKQGVGLIDVYRACAYFLYFFSNLFSLSLM